MQTSWLCRPRCCTDGGARGCVRAGRHSPAAWAEPASPDSADTGARVVRSNAGCGGADRPAVPVVPGRAFPGTPPLGRPRAPGSFAPRGDSWSSRHNGEIGMIGVRAVLSRKPPQQQYDLGDGGAVRRPGATPSVRARSRDLAGGQGPARSVNSNHSPHQGSRDRRHLRGIPCFPRISAVAVRTVSGSNEGQTILDMDGWPWKPINAGP
jgi:hypothetical protein